MIMEVKHSKPLVTNPESIRECSKEQRSRTAARAALTRTSQIAPGTLQDRDLANCVYPRQRRRTLLNEGIEFV